MTTPETKRLLIVEDSPDDAELIALALQADGMNIQWERAETFDEITEAFRDKEWDAIISDYKLGAFTATEVLGLYKQYELDVPFIVVSGTIGEETAAKLMKAGAHDFFLKDRLQRLPTAIERETREADIRRLNRMAEARLKESEERFRTLANAAPVMIWGGADPLRRDYFNAPWFVFRDRLPEKEESEGWIEGVHLDDIKSLRDVLGDAASKRIAYEVEYRLRRADGEYRWIMERALPRLTANGEFIGYLGSCVDITDLKHTETALRHAIESRDEFLSAASHEFQTPITTLVLQLGLLRKNILNNADQATLCQRVDAAELQAKRLSELVFRLLDVTRISGGKLKLSPEKMDLREMVSAVVEAVRESKPELSSKFVIEADQPVIGTWDRVQLETVVTNLLTNAIKYGNDKPIDVHLEQSDSTARIKVVDRGIGIDENIKEHIFDLFRRGVSGTHYAGLGIGLWLVKQVVEAHGGHIEVESQPGKGSTFIVDLPTSPQARGQGGSSLRNGSGPLDQHTNHH